jgi:hypothetical protein
MSRARSSLEAPIVFTVAGFLAAPRWRARPLAFLPAAVVIVERVAVDGEFVLPVGLRHLGEGALPGVAQLSVAVHGGRRG